ncbi:MAG: hypothetical protein NVS3B19_06760 [Ginsengibacter sp.]
MKTVLFIVMGLLLFFQNIFSQSHPKQLTATRIKSSIKIDGDLSEAVWKSAPAASDFIEYRPKMGQKELYETRTEMYFLYDDNSIYVGGYCHERTKDSILKEMSGRDNFGSSDYVGFAIDTYHDRMNAVEFIVTSSGEQSDGILSPPDPSINKRGEDFSWNAVWESNVKIKSDGWTFEMRIPYSALRFSSKDVQTWGLNFYRKRALSEQLFFWNPIDRNVFGIVNQEGELTDIANIKAPLRLSFSPYLSSYVNHYPYKTKGITDFTHGINGGMDVKYGINSSFTLDMTLVPDFGQVQSDNKVLNLTPFEVKYNENRPFFTEGIELFSKGNLFYSRRVGGTPLHHGDLVYNSNEHIVSNPTESKLINATKISGRTLKGLGIGIFNAITQSMYATIEDDKGNTRQIQTSPLTNYNIFVLDQNLKNNSSLSFINTSVIRKGSDYNADVAGLIYNYNDKKALYTGSAKVTVSNLSDKHFGNLTGYAHNVSFGKSGGQFNFDLTQLLTDDKFNINDLGILNNNNFLEHDFLGTKYIKPNKYYNVLYLANLVSYSRRYVPSVYQNISETFQAVSQLKNLRIIDFSATLSASGNDFYEPRVNGRFFKTPSSFKIGITLRPNLSRRFQLSGWVYNTSASLFNKKMLDLQLVNQYRFTDKFSMGLQINFVPVKNDAGYADLVGNEIIFSRRNVQTLENIFNAKYNFNKHSGITFRTRHYLSKVTPKEFFTLQNDGNLVKNSTYRNNLNNNLNIFNIDMVYVWEFAPGSFINLVYKNSIFTGDQKVYNSYLVNFKNTLYSPQNNDISFKIIYYLDYLKIRNKRTAFS